MIENINKQSKKAEEEEMICSKAEERNEITIENRVN